MKKVIRVYLQVLFNIFTIVRDPGWGDNGIFHNFKAYLTAQIVRDFSFLKTKIAQTSRLDKQSYAKGNEDFYHSSFVDIGEKIIQFGHIAILRIFLNLNTTWNT